MAVGDTLDSACFLIVGQFPCDFSPKLPGPPGSMRSPGLQVDLVRRRATPGTGCANPFLDAACSWPGNESTLAAAALFLDCEREVSYDIITR